VYISVARILIEYRRERRNNAGLLGAKAKNIIVRKRILFEALSLPPLYIYLDDEHVGRALGQSLGDSHVFVGRSE
jgi:hypothetical protein